MAVSYENWNWRRNEILFRNLKIIIVKQFFETWTKIFDTPSIISNIKISSPSILLFNLLSKLIFPREFSSQKKKKSGIKGKQVFQEDRFQSFQTVRLTPDRLGRSNSSNRYRTPPDIARSISIQWTAHAILKRSVALLALSTFYLQLRRNFRVTSVKCPPFLPLCVFR